MTTFKVSWTAYNGDSRVCVAGGEWQQEAATKEEALQIVKTELLQPAQWGSNGVPDKIVLSAVVTINTAEALQDFYTLLSLIASGATRSTEIYARRCADKYRDYFNQQG